MHCVGVDIGGTNARVAIVETATGRVVRAEKKTLIDHSPAAVVAVLGALVEEISKDHSITGGLGIGFAGMVQGSMVLNAPNFGWRNVDLGGLLRARLGKSVQLVNDLSAAAWGEFCAGVARGAQETFTVFVGSGVGSAIIANGQLLSGATNVSGEFGHVKVVPTGGRLCGCGQLGCLEAYAGGVNLERWMREVNLHGTVADLEKLAATGDAAATELYEFAATHLALAVANQVTVLNPAVLVLGGGVLMHAPGLERAETASRIR